MGGLPIASHPLFLTATCRAAAVIVTAAASGCV